MQGGLKRHVVQVRYGLFFAPYTDKMYFWEIVLATRKIGIVGISVFGRSMGTQRQALLALLILFLCVSLEIAGAPFLAVSERHKVLGRLELATLFTLWGTMWCGTLIFASQAPGDGDFVIFLSVVIALGNVGIMLWLVFQLIAECAFENKDSRLGRALRSKSLGRIGSWRSRRQARSETVDTADIGIELSAGNESEIPMTGSTVGRRNLVNISNPAFEVSNLASAAPEAEALESAASEPSKWVRHFDNSSLKYYWQNGETGESSWEGPSSLRPGAAEERSRRRARYVKHKTDEGESYFAPESGEGKTLWHLPEGAEIVKNV
jgi:hypothetical protein